MPEILHLNQHREFFTAIAGKTKHIEYRRQSPYWRKGLEDRKYDVIVFRSAYAKDAPEMKVEFVGFAVTNPATSSRQGTGVCRVSSRAPKLRITPCMLLIRSGKTVRCLKPGQSRRRFRQRIVEQGRISRCIWIIRNLRALRFARPWPAAGLRCRDQKAAGRTGAAPVCAINT
jgi:hypothetical protein